MSIYIQIMKPYFSLISQKYYNIPKSQNNVDFNWLDKFFLSVDNVSDIFGPEADSPNQKHVEFNFPIQMETTSTPAAIKTTKAIRSTTTAVQALQLQDTFDLSVFLNQQSKKEVAETFSKFLEDGTAVKILAAIVLLQINFYIFLAIRVYIANILGI